MQARAERSRERRPWWPPRWWRGRARRPPRTASASATPTSPVPRRGSTGDTLITDDILPDGYGIEAHLSDGRIATTRGHSANSSDETSGNLTENTTWQMWVCVVKGSFSTCSSKIGVKA